MKRANNIPALKPVNELIQPQRMTIEVGRDTYTVTGPCLLAQLQAALAQGAESAGGAGVAASRPPAALNALDLWLEIQFNTHYLAKWLGIDRRDRNERSPVPHVGRLLRTVTVTAHGRGVTPMVDRIEVKARGWCSQISSQLTGRRHERAIRGASCAQCESTTVLDQRDDGVYRSPALVLVTRDWLSERWIICYACGWNMPLADHVIAELFPDTDWAAILPETAAAQQVDGGRHAVDAAGT